MVGELFQPVRPRLQKGRAMKKKLVPTKDRPSTSISMRVPMDVLEKLKRIAPMKGMSGYQSLIKYYIGQGLLRDIDLLRIVEEDDQRLESTLRKIGLEEKKIEEFWKEWAAPTHDDAVASHDAKV
jgi:hypothetical protein